MAVDLYCRDSLHLPFADNSICSIITDPPYGLGNSPNIAEILRSWLSFEEYDHGNATGFMAQKWDVFVPDPRYWREAYRVLKPGGFALVFAGSRTQDFMALSMRLAGFQIRDVIMWLYGSGFPKSHNISKAIDKKLDVQRRVIGTKKQTGAKFKLTEQLIDNGGFNDPSRQDYDITEAATMEAYRFEGYGTALKPAYEPILVAMKPIDGTYAENAMEYGTAGLNIDGGRVATHGEDRKKHLAEWERNQSTAAEKSVAMNKGLSAIDLRPFAKAGRWPANIILDEEAGVMLDEQSGESISAKPRKIPRGPNYKNEVYGNGMGGSESSTNRHGDSGGASRFFYCAKASRSEREFGLSEFDQHITNDGRSTPIDNAYQRGDTLRRNVHPTVKPLSLMRYLCRLIGQPDGDILDNFMGSGTTGMAAVLESIPFHGIEREQNFFEIAGARISYVEKHKSDILSGKLKMKSAKRKTDTTADEPADEPADELSDGKQLALF